MTRGRTNHYMDLPKKVVTLGVLFVAGWIALVQGNHNKPFVQGSPIKPFEVIHNDVFCENANTQKSQCSRMNNNYLKFYFSVFLTIAWGGAVRTVIKTFELSIPYTCVLLITGLIIGLGSRINIKFCETWSQFTSFARTPPELILYIFLPILIFESAFSMKAHVFTKSFLAILVVALPGMLLSTFITAVASRQFMDNYGWTFSQASLFGAIISATDPVAVVAILRELGTSELLSVMIEGESLLNDGVAILLYEIFKEIVEEPATDKDPTLGILKQFIRIAIGGPTFGYFMGKLSIACLSTIFNDAATEITITLVSAYLTYFVGEFYLGVSGVMAVVLLGVTISAESTCISPEVEHAVHQFWEMMSFLANTVLFVLVGVIISETAINSFEIRDGYNVIWLYFALNIIRLLMLIILSPLIVRTGYVVSWRNIIVMMWGGLRGAVGICLALEVYKSNKMCKFQNFGPKVLLQTAGIVILTLLVNGSTTKSLLDYLGVTTLSIGKLQDMANAVKTITSARVRTITALKHDRFLADANWEIVYKFTHLKNPYLKKHKAHDMKATRLMEKRLKRLKHAPKVLNKELIEEGHLSKAILIDSTRDQPEPFFSTSTKATKPVISKNIILDLKSGASTFLLHKGRAKVKNSSAMEVEQVVVEEDSKTDVDPTKNPSPMEGKAMMEEARLRVLKAMKISCWRQYERGALSEAGVKFLISAIESKEDALLTMMHVQDVSEYWTSKGFSPWIRQHIFGFLDEEIEAPKPKARWRHPFYWLTTQSWFHGIIYFVIFLNTIPISYETQLLILDREPQGWEVDFLFIATIIFTSIYAVEFILKIIGCGVHEYFASRWNWLDFGVLIASIVEMIMAIVYRTDGPDEPGNKAKGFSFIKNIRIVRFVRLLRWARPLLPLLSRIFQSKVNARLFTGYDVGKGYIQSIEDALRFLPQMVENMIIQRKFKLMLEVDRLETKKAMGLLQHEHPGVVVAVKTKHASRSINNQMMADLEDLRVDGLLDDKEFSLLSLKIESNLKRLWASPPSVTPMSPESLMENMSWVVGNPELLAFCQDNCTQEIIKAGEVIYNLGDPPNGIYLIISGLLKLHYEPTEEIVKNKNDRGMIPNSESMMDLQFTTTVYDYLGTGSFVGVLGMLTNQPRAASIICETDALVYHWSAEVIHEGMRTFDNPYDSLESRLWRTWGIRLTSEFLHTEHAYSSWTTDRIRAHLETGVVPVGEKFDFIEIPEIVSETFLVYGELANQNNGEVIRAPATLPLTWTKVGPTAKAIVKPRLLLLASEESIDELSYDTNKDSLTSLHKCIIHGPSAAAAMSQLPELDDDEEDTAPEKVSKASGSYGRAHRKAGLYQANPMTNLRRQSLRASTGSMIN